MEPDKPEIEEEEEMDVDFVPPVDYPPSEDEEEPAQPVRDGESPAPLTEAERKKLAARSDRERIRKLKLDQRKALDELRDAQNTEVVKDEKQRGQDRLNYLLERTDIFSHFVKAPLAAGSATDSSSSSGKRRRGRHTAEGVDVDDTESNFVTRWTETPSFIHGGEMKDYQLAGLNWLIKLYDNGINGILADEMGLGKTLQTLSFLCYLKTVRQVNGPHMVIVPKSTLTNWINEFKRWTPSMNVLAFHGNKEERAVLKETMLQPGKFDAVVTTYEMATRERLAFNRFKWRYLIIDEAHRIKNEQSVLAKVVRFYHSQNRLLITGTPLQNNLHELWALLNFLLPDVFSSSEDFDSWFDLKGDAQQTIDRLHKVLRPFLLRRIKSEVAKGLPPKTETKLYVGMSAMQREWYQRLLLKDIDAINSAIGADGPKKGGPKPRLLNILMQLRKVCNHPYLFPGAEPSNLGDQELPHMIASSGKLVLLDKLLSRLKVVGSRVLIFSQMTALLDILEDYMVYVGHDYCRIDGQTSMENRQSQIDVFNAPDSPKFCFLLSTRAGGLGINLATADTVILFDSDWNPQADLQAQDRAHRLGQTKPVQVYRFVTEGSVEEKIVERAELKLKIDALVIQQGRLVEQNKALSKDEMLSMIRFGADQIFSSKTSTITDEDIDIILGKGKERSAEFNEKLKKVEKNVLDTSFTGESEFDMWTFEGESYKNKRVTEMFLQVPKRERNRPAVDARTKEAAAKRRNFFRSSAYPHQFYPPRMYELVKKEDEANKRKSAEMDRRSRQNLDMIGIDDMDFGGLSPEEEAEKQSLLDKGFRNWGKRDFWAFMRGCEAFGRDNYEAIAEACGDRTPSEIRKYAAVFWTRYKEIPGIQAKITKVLAGEKRIQRKKEMVDAITEKLASISGPKELKFAYGPTTKGRYFTEEEDVYLIYETHNVGYGNWEALRQSIRTSREFRFNWFMKSRTPAQLQARTEALIRIIQKELADKNGRTFISDRRRKNRRTGESAADNAEASGDEDSGDEAPASSSNMGEAEENSKKRPAPSDAETLVQETADLEAGGASSAKKAKF
jgi:SWI/SNF-related matrix-associated actin-dependent regulator of chromatin subfamily A member 5